LRSTLTLTNTDGTARREIVVPGIILANYALSQPAEGVVLKELEFVRWPPGERRQG